MTNLSDTQAIILAAAAQRADGNLLPLPGSLRGGAAIKVVTALLARGLAREEVTELQTGADAALNTIWRNDDDRLAILLRITAAGRAAISIEVTAAPYPDAAAADLPAEAAQEDASQRHVAGRTDSTAGPASPTPEVALPASASHTGPRRGRARESTKQALLIAMLRRKEGATIAQIVEATGWQPHTVRGALAGALKKRLGLAITSEKTNGARLYRIAD